MRACFSGIVLLLLVAQGCSLGKLNREIQRADQTYSYLKVAPISPSITGGRVLVVLYRESDEGLELINYRVPTDGEASFFLVPIDQYTVLAFEDLNQDFIYQPGEPAARTDRAQLFTEPIDPRAELDYDAIVGEEMTLSASYQLEVGIDLSPLSLPELLERSRRNYLKLTDWDNPDFSRDSIKRGLWEPLTFHEQTGYGLYLLEELDPAKQPLLLVHGISASPTDFKELAGVLDGYQLLLFHYPSGFPLDHTAYILHVAITDFLQRTGQEKMHVLAHSMGGLVSRGMLLANDAQTNARFDTFITLATPWSGHDAARSGVQWSPAIAPVWKSMVPESNFLQLIFSKPLPDSVQHHLFFTYARSRGGPAKGDDGVVGVSSQLRYQAQREAGSLFGIDDDHTGILSNPCVRDTIAVILDNASHNRDRPMPGCDTESAE